MTTTLANQLPRINLANGGSMQSAQVVTLKSGQQNASPVDSKSPMRSFELRTSSTLLRLVPESRANRNSCFNPVPTTLSRSPHLGSCRACLLLLGCVVAESYMWSAWRYHKSPFSRRSCLCSRGGSQLRATPILSRRRVQTPVVRVSSALGQTPVRFGATDGAGV